MKKIGFLFCVCCGALLLASCQPAAIPAPVYELADADEFEEEKPAAPPAPEPTPEAYTVKAGDTLIAIALRYDLDYTELARWNNLRDANLISPGQRLRMTAPANEPRVGTVPAKAPGSTSALKPVRVDAPSAAPAAGAAVNSAAAVASAAPAPTPPTTGGGVKPQSTVITGSSAAATPAGAPYKSGPAAQKYVYSKARLAKLRSDWTQSQKTTPAPAGAAASAAAQTAALAPAPAVAAPAPVPSARAGKTAERYGITWSQPTDGATVGKFSESTKGVAYKGKRGAPIYAAADGTVIYVGSGVKSYGRLVIIRHRNGYITAYAHNEEILVKENQQVARGGKIATMGDSGSDRVMLHFEMRKGGKPINPALALPK